MPVKQNLSIGGVTTQKESAPYIRTDMGKKVNEEVGYYIHSFEKAYLADSADRARGIRNMQGYTSYNNGQYSRQDMQDLADEGRDPNTYNLIQMIVRGHAGNMIMNWFDPRFVPREEGDLDAFEALQKLWYAFKEHYNYKASALRAIENGLVYRGVEEIVIDKPTPNPRTWGVKFENIRPDMVIFDPDNTSDRLSRTSSKAWKAFYMTPQQAIRIWPDKEDEIERSIRNSISAEYFKSGTESNYEPIDLDSFIDLSTAVKMGNKLQFVQLYDLVNERVTRQIIKDGAIEIPQTQFKFNSAEDIAMKQAWAAERGIILSNDNLLTFDTYENCLYTRVWCKNLGIVLENRKDSRQFGHLPLYAWSYLEKHGKSMGVVDFIWDSQQDFNRREMAKTKYLTKTPIGGKPYMHEMLFGGNSTRMEEESQNFNDPSHVMQIPEDVPPALVSSLIGIIPGSQLNPAIFQDENIKLEIINRVGSLPPAMQGFSERTGESGVYLGRKVIEGTVMNRLPMESYIQHENDKAEDWVVLVKKVCGGPHNYNRTFRSGDGGSAVTINRLVGVDEDGNDMVEADISKLNRVEVIISQMKENDYMKQANREMNIGALQAIPPTQYNAGVRAVFEARLAQGMDFTDDAEKEQVDKMVKQSLALAEMNNLVQLETLKAQLNQIQAQMAMTQQAQQMQAQQAAQPAPQQGEGQPEVMPERQPVMRTAPTPAPGRFEAAEQRAEVANA